MKKTKEWLQDGTISVIGGLFLGVFAVFALIASASHMLNWKADQSSLEASSFLADGMQVSNHAGGVGARLGNFLVGDCFGLSAVIFAVVLGIIAYKMCTGRKIDWVRAAVLGIFMPFSLSMVLAYVGLIFNESLGNAFGGGIGGGACAFLVSGLNAMVGRVVSLLFVLVLAAAIFLLLNENIVAWMRREPSSEAKDDAKVRDKTDQVTIEDTQLGIDGDLGTAETLGDGAGATDAFGGGSGAGVDAGTGAEAGALANGGGVANGGNAAIGADPELTIMGPEEELSTEIEEELPQLDIRSDVDRYSFPSLDILKDYADKRFPIPHSEIEQNTEKIKATLASFKIPIQSIKASVGYTVTLYRIILGEGVRVNQVKSIEEDIAIKIGIKGVRVVILADAVGIEVPNARPSVVPLKAVLNSDAFRNAKAELPIAVGYTITSKAKVFDLAEAPHLLVAGATKMGKSVGLNAIISSLLFSKHPTELKFVFIDPKMVEFQQYSKLIDHYLAILPGTGEDESKNAIVTEPKVAEAVLSSLCIEMDERYKLMSTAGVNKITDYNERFRNRRLLPTKGHHFMPYLVVVVDEYADLTKSLFGTDRNLARSIENSINRLAAKGRAAGLHVIIATQRPSVDVITGTIKGNFPTRMAFRTSQRQDSQTILGMPGAERLIGKGDMLFFSGDDPERVQCALVDSDEIDELTSFIASQQGYKQRCTEPYYLPEPLNPDGSSSGDDPVLVDMKAIDPMFSEAARLAVMNQEISTSNIQRKLQVGFARAGRIMDQLEAAGVVGPQKGSKPRETLVPDLASLQSILDAFVK